eukprot:gene4993-6942_t
MGSVLSLATCIYAAFVHCCEFVGNGLGRFLRYAFLGTDLNSIATTDTETQARTTGVNRDWRVRRARMVQIIDHIQQCTDCFLPIQDFYFH